MPSLEWNKQVWGTEWAWEKGGDEWSGMAAYCGQPYEEWKSGLADTFIRPYIRNRQVLEIAPGFGRWTAVIAESAQRVDLVDINEKCLDACRERFSEYQHIKYHLGDGTYLPVPSASIDFVWSFDAFVHMDPAVIAAYIREIERVLKPGGTAIIHHANKRPWSLALVPVTSRLGRVGKVAQQMASQGRIRDDGARSHVTAAMVAEWVESCGLAVVQQTRSWGAEGEFTVDKYHDVITEMRKP